MKVTVDEVKVVNHRLQVCSSMPCHFARWVAVFISDHSADRGFARGVGTENEVEL